VFPVRYGLVLYVLFGRNSIFEVLDVIQMNPKLRTVMQNPISGEGFLSDPVLADSLANFAFLKTDYNFLLSHKV
jgi:hypothetical protein